MTELEVTGVSRSGRVRKKSSKLTDFESLDEIDIRTNSRVKKEKYEAATPTAANRPIKKERIIKEEISDVEEGDLTVTSNSNIKPEQYSEESDNEGYQQQNEDSSMDSLGSEMDEVDDGELEQEDGFQPITGDDSSDDTSPQRGLYATDRNKRKVTIKDGKFLGKVKPSKKDKGIWKRRGNSRTSIVVKKQQGGTIGHSQRSAVVPLTTVQEPPQLISGPGQVRKAKTSPTRKFGGKQTQQPLQQQQQQQLQQQQSQQHSHQLSSPAHVNTTPSVTSMDSKIHPKSGITSETSVFKPVSTSAMDVAAHLKLLGESLTIIGERLTEHEGQIAVSGSFSVLLDSLLCALGPLLCLTQQVPQMNVVPQEQLSQMMDNIAYIMPGL